MSRLIGFRKFIVALIFFVVMITFRVFDLVSGAEFAETVRFVLIAFMGANFADHIADWRKS
jgi:hypothetical protein